MSNEFAWFGRVGPIALVLLASVLALILIARDEPLYIPGVNNPYVIRNLYEGEIEGYRVRIIREERASGATANTVRLQPLADYEAGRPDWVNIVVAHDIDGDLLLSGDWERIIWFGEEFGDQRDLGRDLVVRVFLTDAVLAVYNPEHLVMDTDEFLAAWEAERAGS